jgi:hypothetical protein
MTGYLGFDPNSGVKLARAIITGPGIFSVKPNFKVARIIPVNY